MKKVKNYIAADLAKKKIARYKYWSIKDETGITITSSEDAQDGRSFTELLDKIIADNVDAEIQVKFGTNEASSRQNAPIFIRINESIEWIEPEDDDTIKINGMPHKVDKNGNVNINFTPPINEPPVIEANPMDSFRQEMELQLQGLKQENELQKKHFDSEIHNKLMEQNLKFKELMLSDREARIAEREQLLAQQEALLEEKQKEMSDDVKGYVKHIPKALGGLVKDWLKDTPKKETLGQTEKQKTKPRNKVAFEFEDTTELEPIIEEDETIDTEIIEDEGPLIDPDQIEMNFNNENEQETPNKQDEHIQD